MRKISRSQFVDILRQTEGSKCARITYTVSAECRKTGNPFAAAGKTVMKTVSLSTGLGWDYNRRVPAEMAREGLNPLDWQAEPRKWGKRVDLFTVVHTPKGSDHEHIYMTVHPIATLGEVVYTVDGQVVPKEAVEPFLPPKRESAKQAEAGVEKETVYRDLDIENLKEVAMLDEVFEVVPD